MLLRRIARPLLATGFIADGTRTLVQPDTAAQNPALSRLPGDPATVVRVTAAARIGGALVLALGTAPRTGAAVVAATTVPTLLGEDFWAEADPALRSAKRSAFVKDIGLLGGAMIAAADTEGKPSLAWRGRRAARRATRAISGSANTTELPDGQHLVRQARGAAATGAGLAGRARQEAGRLTDTIREHGPHWAATAKDYTTDVGERLTEVTGDVGERLGDAGDRLLATAREHGGDLARTASHRIGA
ncbi:MAG: DoxX family protein [Nocardia sp.]|nr:DoxX family protein [Nocardia sp.]